MVFVLLILMLPAMPSDVYAGSTASFVFSDGGITAPSSYYDCFINGTDLTIRADGVYEITGSCSDGSVTVRDGLSDVVIILKDLTLKSTKTAPVVIKKKTSASIHTEGTVSIYDNEDPKNEDSPDKAKADAFEGAAIKLKKSAKLTFCGDGTLNIYGNAKNGISGGEKAELAFSDSRMTYNITSSGNAVSCDGGITIRDGSFTIEAGKDGIKSVPEADDADSAGTVTVYGGDLDIHADGDAIQADRELTVYNGDFDVRTFTGYYTDGTRYWNAANHKNNSHTGDFDKGSMSCKGFKASGDREGVTNTLNIYGGNFIVDTSDDSFHSDCDAVITGGTFVVDSGDDAFHADHSLTIGTQGGYERDPEITVNHSYEGMESSHVYFYQGRYYCIAATDGINASGEDKPSAVSDCSIEIYGGIFYINSNGDGFDSNGSLILKGGNAVIYSMPANREDSPVDSNGEMLIDGMTLLGAGSYGVDGTLKPKVFNQPYYQQNVSGRELTTIRLIQDGALLFSDILPKRISYILYTSPDLTDGAVTFENSGDVDTCVSNDWNHSYGELEVETEPDEGADGLGRYTCGDCGRRSYKTLLYDEYCSCEGHEGVPFEEDEGYKVTFECDGGVDSLDVYYAKDDDVPYISDPPYVLSRDGDTGFPCSDGNGQVNFRVNIGKGFEIEEVTATPGTYKNLKQDPEENGDTGLWRMTKVKKKSTVTVTTKERAVLLSDKNITLLPGKTYQTEAIVGSGRASAANAVFKSSDPGCVTVDSSGKITALKQGTSKITISPKNGGKAATCSVRVLFTDVPVTHSYYKPVCWAADNGITGGYTDGSGAFGIKDPVTRGQVVTFLWRLAGKPEPKGNKQTFKDVPVKHPFYKAIQWAYEKKITAGYKNGKFGVGDNCTRGQIATFLWRYAGRPSPKGSRQTFTDIPVKHAYYKAVQWASEKGITAGYKDGSFGVDKDCTRGHMVTFLWRSSGKPG